MTGYGAGLGDMCGTGDVQRAGKGGRKISEEGLALSYATPPEYKPNVYTTIPLSHKYVTGNVPWYEPFRYNLKGQDKKR